MPPDIENEDQVSAPRRTRLRRITSSFSKITGALPILVEKFDWKWVLLGTLLIVGANVIGYFALRTILHDLIIRQERVLTGAMTMGGVALTIYFLGGVLVGRMAAGRTVKEPAVAAVLSVAILFFLQLFAGMINVVGLIVGTPICFGVAYLGGLVGDKWQRKVRPD